MRSTFEVNPDPYHPCSGTGSLRGRGAAQPQATRRGRGVQARFGGDSQTRLPGNRQVVPRPDARVSDISLGCRSRCAAADPATGLTSVAHDRWWLVYLLIAAVAGCAPLPQRIHTRPSQPLPPKLVNYYQYNRQPLEDLVESTQPKSGYQVQRLQLTAANDPSFRPIKIDWYRPDRPGRLPVILMSPILAGNDLYVREFAQHYAARGLHSVIVYRPKEIFSPDRNLTDIETHFQESIIQLRRAIDWLETLDSVDPQRIGSFAISLGAILTVPLAAVEPRIKAHVFGLPAGHLPEVIMTSKDKTLRKRRKAFLERHGWSQEEGLRQLKNVITSEPMRFAPSIDPGKVLIIAGLFDRVLGVRRSLDLWQAMGHPPLIVLPTGHYTATLATPYLKIVTYSFFRRRLEPNGV